MKIKGKYFNGKTAKPYNVWLKIRDQNLYMISEDQTKQKKWALQDTHVLDEPMPPQPARLIHKHNADERLYIHTKDGWNTLKTQLPKECFQRISLSLNGPSFIGYVGATIALIVFLFILAPTILESSASFIPDTWQKKAGHHAINSFAAGKTCDNEKSMVALNTLMNRLKQGTNRDIKYDVIVIKDSETINAFAGPGAVFGIFSATITKADTPEQLAGVMAHEIAHTELYHPTRGFVRDSGIALLFQMMFGTDANIMDLARIGGALKYSRDKEREADEYGQNILLNANIDPQAMTSFFEDMILPEEIKSAISDDIGDGTFKDALSYLSTHPETQKRIEALKQNKQKPENAAPILTQQEWSDLQNICENVENNEKETAR